MRQYLPYNILLVIAVATTGLMIFYNITARDTFAATVAYTIPGTPQPKQDPPLTYSESGDEYEEAAENENNDENDTALTENTVISVDFPLDINLATEDELKFIPMVGVVMAQRIIQYRDIIGGYTSLNQLKEIKGIGDNVFERISAYLIIKQDDDANSEAKGDGAG